jgi:hypothetical protein
MAFGWSVELIEQSHWSLKLESHHFEADMQPGQVLAVEGTGEAILSMCKGADG